VREHDASAADAEASGGLGDETDHHLRTGAGEAGSAVMLGKPIARVAEAIRRACKVEGIP
jgi:hypothetical protein